MSSELPKPATPDERKRWVEDARLGFVRPGRGPAYIHDKTVVAKILALDALITELEAKVNEMQHWIGSKM